MSIQAHAIQWNRFRFMRLEDYVCGVWVAVVLILAATRFENSRRNRKRDRFVGEIRHSHVGDVTNRFAGARNIDVDLVIGDQQADAFLRK